jgi:hypothetical protein
MERKRRVRAIWGLAGAVLAVAAIVVPLLVLAGSGQATLTAETYADVIRFGVQGAGTLQIQIYDLSEKVLWDSGEISSDFVDWDRTDTWDERLANGYYLYLAQAWDMSGSLILSKTGKVALLPGDQAQLQAAPSSLSSDSSPEALGGSALTSQPRGLSDTGIFGTVGIGTSSPGYQLDVEGKARLRYAGGSAKLIYDVADPANDKYAYMLYRDQGVDKFGLVLKQSTDQFFLWDYVNSKYVWDYSPASQSLLLLESGNGKIGVGTSNPTASLTVQGTSGDLIAAYNSSNRVFVVKSTGEVRADGVVYAASFNTGSADVAERINTSEWVEAGDVVEIDPDHTGFFRKSADPYSRRVAGIISTSPGVILGNSTDSETGDWDDNRPVLAITGRVPVKVTTENGPIQVGDLLVASSAPGVAMRGDPAAAVGCVVGKAMEPLAEGEEGTIVAQVMLR